MAGEQRLTIDQRAVYDALLSLPRRDEAIADGSYELETEVAPNDAVYAILKTQGLEHPISRNGVKVAIKDLRRMGYTGFIHQGRPPHIWTVTLPRTAEEPGRSVEDVADIANFNADMLRIAGAVQDLQDENVALVRRVIDLEGVEAENLRLSAEAAKATARASELETEVARKDALLEEARHQIDECLRNLARLEIPDTLRNLIKSKED